MKSTQLICLFSSLFAWPSPKYREMQAEYSRLCAKARARTVTDEEIRAFLAVAREAGRDIFDRIERGHVRSWARWWAWELHGRTGGPWLNHDLFEFQEKSQ